MNRRSFLHGAGVGAASIAGASATAGCLDRLRRQPVLVRVAPATGDETDVRCSLTESFVAEHPPLERALSRASGNDRLEWASVDVGEETAQDLVDDLHRHCEETGGEYRGLYHYRDRYYFISVSPRGNRTPALDRSHEG